MGRRMLVLGLCWMFLSTLGLALTWGQTPAQLVNGNRTHAGATNYGVTTGTSTAYVLTLNKPIPAYADGSCYLLELHTSNTGPATLNVNGRGAKTIFKYVSGASTALGAGDFGAGQVVEVCYDGVNMQAQLGGGGGGGGGSGDIGTVGSCTSADCFTAASPSASLTFNNATSGTVRLETVPGALSSNVARLKAETGSICTDASVCTGYQATLSNVSNDAQLKRAANDFAAFTQKAVPVSADKLLVEDSAAAGAKKWIDVGSLPTGAGGAGDVQAVGTCASGDCFTSGTPSAALFMQAAAAPGAPAAGSGVVYYDLTNLNLTVKTAGNIIKHGVQTSAPVTNQFVTGVQADGALQRAQPDFAGLSGVASDAQVPDLTTLSSGLTPSRCVETNGTDGKLTVAAGACGTGGGGGTGDVEAVGTCTSGPCFTAGTPSATLYVQAAAAPGTPAAGSGAVYYDTTNLNLTVKTAGGVTKHAVQTTPPVANQFVTGVLADGTLQLAQPTFAGLSGTASVVTLTGTQRLTNKQIDQREVALADVASVPVNVDLGDVFIRNTMSVNPTFQVPTGTGGNPTCSQDITFRLSTASERAVTWTAGTGGYVAVGIPLPTVLRATPLVNHIKFRYNCTNTNWELVAINLKTGSETAYVNLPITGIKMHPTLPTGPSVAAATTIVWFDENTQECVLWDWTIPGDYLGTPVLRLWYTMLSDTITSHSATFNVRVWAMKAGQTVLPSPPLANFDPTINNCDDSNIPGTVGVWNDIGCALTANDAMAANDPVQFEICSDTSGTWTGDLGLLRARFEYAK